MAIRTSLLVGASMVMSLAFAACGASVALENRPCPCAAGWTCCAAENVCVADGTSCTAEVAPVGGFASNAVATSQSICAGSKTEDALDHATSATDATTKLAIPSAPGAFILDLQKGWLACDRSRWLADRGGDGIVFSPEGTWTLLKLDGDGGLTPLGGLGTHGSWTLYGEGSSEPLQRRDPTAKKITVLGLVDDGAAPGSFTTALLEFERSTGRLRLSRSSTSPPEQTWFAPLAGMPRCDEYEDDVHVPTCFCREQCRTLLSGSACETDTFASQCIAACQSATADQRKQLAGCGGSRLPPASGAPGGGTSPSCDPLGCALTIGWSPDGSPVASADGGSTAPGADAGE